MGKTFKDQRKWERKQKDREGQIKESKTPKRKRYEEIVPEDDPLNQYEYLDYEYNDDDR